MPVVSCGSTVPEGRGRAQGGKQRDLFVLWAEAEGSEKKGKLTILFEREDKQTGHTNALFEC
jgi:hypothetical protein